MTPLAQTPTPPPPAPASPKKVILVVVGIVGALLLLAALFVGVILGVIFYTINRSEAAETARTFLRQNERLRQDIGEVRGFGRFVSGNISAQPGGGQAVVALKVIGARKTVGATVELAYRGDSPWRVVYAAYRNEAGRAVPLLERYADAAAADPDPTLVPPPSKLIRRTSDESFARDALGARGPVLVEFITTYSEEGRKLAPTLDAVAERYAGRVTFLHMNIGEDPQTYQHYQVDAIPTLILFNGGQERARVVGATNVAELSRLLDKELRAAPVGREHVGTK